MAEAENHSTDIESGAPFMKCEGFAQITDEANSGVAGSQRHQHHGEYLRPLGLQVQDHLSAGDGDRACATGGRRLRKPLEGGLSRKSGEKTKVCFDHLLLEKGIRKKPIIGLITGFFGGGDGEIRTLASV